MSEPAVLTHIDARGVATITLNRPRVYNGYNAEMIAGLGDAFARLGGDGAVRVIVFRGNGKHFSAGADVNWFRELAGGGDEDRLAAARAATAVMRAFAEVAKPTIALIHNACMGGATGYAASADIVIASEDAKFAITEVRVGITPAPILPQLIAAIGAANTRRYALGGETFDVFEALRIGLVHQICPVGGLDEAARPVIDALAAPAADAVRETKRVAAKIGGPAFDDGLALELARVSAAGRVTAEGVEGIDAFLDKRKPYWNPDRDRE